MKEFYLNQRRKAVLKLELAKIGYERKMKELAHELSKEDASRLDPIINRINDLREVLKEMVEDVEIYTSKYQAECEKAVEKNAEV